MNPKLNMLFTICCHLRKTKGTKKKKEALENILQQSVANDFAALLKYTYDDTTYGVKSLSKCNFSKINPEKMLRKVNHGDPGIYVKDFFKLLNFLSGKKSISDKDTLEIFKVITIGTTDESILVQQVFKGSLDIGLNKKGINEVYNKVYGIKLIPTFDVMLAKPFNAKQLRFPCYAEPKYDGVRMIVKVSNDGDVTLYSRSGQELTLKFPDLIKEICKYDSLYGYVLDCEVMPIKGSFQQLMTRMTKGMKKDAIQVGLRVFDMIVLEEFNGQINHHTLDVRKLLVNRIKRLKSKKIKAIKRYYIKNETELRSFYDLCISKGHEGIMIKRIDGKYEYKRSYNWMKKKPVLDIDLVVVGVEEGESGSKYEGMTGTIVLEEHNGHSDLKASGMTDKQRKEWWADPSLIIGKTVEIEYQEPTDNGKLRFLQFKRIRIDK